MEQSISNQNELYSVSQTAAVNQIPLPASIIQNVVVSVNLDSDLDLRKIAISARNVEYNPTKVNAVVI